jgi:hypothetical protein
VLNAIPIFHLSFLKMLNQVWKKVVRIQREFLWGGVKGGRKISWVKWSVVCKEKSKGGLGVRDVRLVNLSLLFKWRWRLLQPGRTLWKDVLVAKYGNHITCEVDWSRSRIPKWSSNWWKNIIALEKVVPGKNWFSESVSRKVGNGLSTSFWKVKWLGDVPLEVAFPRLFSLSNFKDHMVRDMWGSDDSWSFSWRRNLFRWEEDLVASLLDLLEPVVFSPEDDCWRWLDDVDEGFSIKSSYKLLAEELGSMDDLENELVVGLHQLWESPTPSKVVAFSWQLLLDRIPTRNNLLIREITTLDRPWECLGCIGHSETFTHLFLHCPCVMKVWGEIFK